MAQATLTYVYDERLVWLEGLASERHAMSHGLCEPHAGALRVPNGWTLEDRRLSNESPPGPALAG